MSRILLLPTLLLCLLGRAQAHSEANPNLGFPGSQNLNAAAGAMLKFDHENEPQVLVAVSHTGWDGKTDDPRLVYRYFWVAAQAFLAEGAEGSVKVAVLDLNIVPATRVETDEHGQVLTERYFPVEIRRDVDAGVLGSVAVHAIGWAGYWQKPVATALTRFAQIAVDVIGLRFAGLQEYGLYLGSQIASVQAETGLGWDISKGVMLSLSLGGRASITAGSPLKDKWVATSLMLLADTEAFARIQLLLGTAIGQLSVFAEGGYHRLQFIEKRQHAYEESHGHGHPYILMGLGGSF